MKKFIKQNINLLLVVGIVTLFFGCEKGPDFKTYEYPAPTATGMGYTIGYPGTYTTITGKDFGMLKGAVKVFFGGTKADSVISCTDGQIVVKVPAGAITGKVTLQVWTHTIDSIGSFTVVPAPAIISDASSNKFGNNLALPGIDTVTIKGANFGTDASKVTVSFSGTPATILGTLTDGMIKVIAPVGYATGTVSVTIAGSSTMMGVTVQAPTALINPAAAGDITKYFLSNFGPAFTRGDNGTGRWGTLGAPWITNAAGLNKAGVGGWAQEGWNNPPGFLNWETWDNTPVVDGIVYQPTSFPLPVGNYKVTLNDYSEIQTNSSVYCVVAAGGSGIPILANLSTALGYVALANTTPIGATSPNVNETPSFTFTLTTSQVVSLGFLGNMKWGNGTSNPGCYFIVRSIKLEKL